MVPLQVQLSVSWHPSTALIDKDILCVQSINHMFEHALNQCKATRTCGPSYIAPRMQNLWRMQQYKLVVQVASPGPLRHPA